MKTRIIAVGDSKQAIYAFRGADTQAIKRIITELSAKVLPLSICYRCPKAVLATIKNLVPHIEAAPHAPEGKVNTCMDYETLKHAKPGDFILCRVTAPLVSLCMKFLRSGVKAFVKGRDIGATLAAFIKSFKETDLDAFLIKVQEFEHVQVARLNSKGRENEAILIADKCDTVFALSEGCKDIPCLLQKIEKLFSDDGVGICLSTVHKAKGLEASRVFILRPELMPHPMAKGEEQYQQELNIKYVAHTRVKFTPENEGELWICGTSKTQDLDA